MGAAEVHLGEVSCVRSASSERPRAHQHARKSAGMGFRVPARPPSKSAFGPRFSHLSNGVMVCAHYDSDGDSGR